MADGYKQFFAEADKDDSGFLTLDELTAVLRKKGYKGTDANIKAMFGSSDFSGDNKISLDEYLTAMGLVPAKDHKAAAMRSCFQSFDADNSGSIDRKELQAVFAELGRTLTEDEVARMISLSDKDESGTINYDEFIAEVFGQ